MTGSPIWGAQVETITSAAATFGDERPAWLVAHSGAGPLLPAVDERMPVGGWVFVDATLPHPGRTRFQTLPTSLVDRFGAAAGAGQLPRWNEWFDPGVIEAVLPDRKMRAAFIAELPDLPRAMFDERMPDATTPPGRQLAYVQLSAAYATEADDARIAGWPLAILVGDHLWPLTHPGAVASAICDVVDGCDPGQITGTSGDP